MKRALVLLVLFLLACGESVTPPTGPVRPTVPQLALAAVATSTVSTESGPLDAGREHTCALRTTGGVVCWGRNPYGQQNVPAGESLTQISAGFATTCGIRTDGSIGCWGSDGSGQTNVPAGTFTQVSAGFYQVCGLRTDQTVTCWGSNAYGQRDLPAGTYKEVSAGNERTCALTTDGTAVCVGSTAQPPAGTFLQISAGGGGHSCAIRSDRTIACWGNNDYHQVDGAPTIGAFTQVSAGDFFTCALRDDGEAVCWGTDGSLPQPGVATPPAGPFVRITVGGYHACGQRSNGFIVCWGRNDGGQLNVPAEFLPTTVSTESGPLDAGPYHTCALRGDGSVACWGHNPYGQQNVPLSERPGQLSAGFATTCGVRSDGTIGCWGSDGSGQTNVEPGTYSRVSAGFYQVCGLRPDGTVACWGSAAYGQRDLPAGTYKEVSAGNERTCLLTTNGVAGCTSAAGFQSVAGTYLQITAGAGGHTCAIRPDGSLACWGSNQYGELTGIPSTGTFTQVSAGSVATCALRDDGEILCWGYDGPNGGGVIHPPLGPFVRLTMGAFHACAQRASGAIVCWGRNDLGQLNIPPDLGENTAPTVSAGGPYTGTEGSPVNFNFSASDADGDALTYTWDLGDGATGSGPAPPTSHTYVDDGAYTVTLAVTDGKSPSVTATSAATVSNVAPTVTVSTPSCDCLTPFFEISFADPAGNIDRTSLDGFTVTWSWGDGQTSTTSAYPGSITLGHTYAKGGAYTVVISVLDKDGGTGRATVAFNLTQPVTIAISPTTVSKSTKKLSVDIAGTSVVNGTLIAPTSLRLGRTAVAKDVRGNLQCATRVNKTTGFTDLGCQFDVGDMRANGDLVGTGVRTLVLTGFIPSDGRSIRGSADITLR